MSIELHLENAAGGDTDLPSREQILAWVSATVSATDSATMGEQHEHAELCIRLVDEAEGRALNQQYRGKDSPTNVLSFPAQLPPEIQSPLLGDLAICLPVVRAEATQQGKSLSHHLAHLIVHGTLHLLGLDHQSDETAAAMEAREISILSGFAIANPYEL